MACANNNVETERRIAHNCMLCGVTRRRAIKSYAFVGCEVKLIDHKTLHGLKTEKYPIYLLHVLSATWYDSKQTRNKTITSH